MNGRRLGAARLSFGALLVFCASVALARPGDDPVVVAIAPMRGPSIQSVEATVERTLRPLALVLGPRRYSIVAKNLIAVGSSPEDIAAVASELGAAWVMTGVVKLDGGRWTLSVSLRDGKSGRARARFKYPLAGPRVSGSVLHTLSTELASGFDDALHGPAVDPDVPAKPDPGTANSSSDDEEPPGLNGKKPVAKKPSSKKEASKKEASTKKESEPAAPAGARPRWARWFELALGPSLTGRHFTFSPSVAKFTSSIVGGIHLEGTVYPLAFTWPNVKGVFSGIGLSIRVDKPIWPASTTPSMPSASFPTTELRVEGGLNWKITLYKGMPRPQLHLIVTGGVHEFTYAKGPDGTNVVGVPDVRYTYASVGGGLTIHFAEWSWLWVDFVYHIVTNSGPIETQPQYGLAANGGLRFQAGLDFLVWKGIRVGAMGFYERFGSTYGYDPNRALIADTSTDEFYGVMFLLGYVF